jgi:outer membrane protein OmpA-like peptidoglycan-associated protein
MKSNPDLPKSFRLTNIKFASGTTDFTLGGDQDLDLIANSLKRFPGSTATIQAYSEETGDEDENLLLSENRAMLIREEIIGRGVEPSRVKAEGRGARSEEDQAYFVLTKIK